MGPTKGSAGNRYISFFWNTAKKLTLLLLSLLFSMAATDEALAGEMNKLDVRDQSSDGKVNGKFKDRETFQDKLEEVTICSWNVKKMTFADKPEHLENSAKFLVNCDFVVLQEVSKGPMKDRLDALKATMNNLDGGKHDYEYQTSTPAGIFTTEIKNRTVEEVHAIFYDKNRGWRLTNKLDFENQKLDYQPMIFTFENDAGLFSDIRLSITSVHFPQKGRPADLKRHCRLFAAKYKILFMEGMPPLRDGFSDYHIVTGDFNTTPDMIDKSEFLTSLSMIRDDTSKGKKAYDHFLGGINFNHPENRIQPVPEMTNFNFKFDKSDHLATCMSLRRRVVTQN